MRRNNKMTKSFPIGSAALGAILLTGCFGIGDDSNNPRIVGYEGEMVAVGAGTTVEIYGIDATGTPAKLGEASLPGEHWATHRIFGIVKHPAENVLYVTSFNDRFKDDEDTAGWGNARIDRFSYTEAGELTYAGPAFIYDAESGPSCADEDWQEDYPGQVGTCAPNTAVFSPDGTRLYVDDDRLDNVQIFSVDSESGELAFVWEGAAGYTSYHGLAVSPSGGYIYNGSHVFALTEDTVVPVTEGAPGNATEVVAGPDGEALLVTTEWNDTLAIYSLADEEDLVLIGSALVDTEELRGTARYQDASADLGLFIVSGYESVATYMFNGVSLTFADRALDTNEGLEVYYRSTQITKDGRFALATYFIPADPEGNPLGTGGMVVFAIDEEGKLTQLDDIDFGDRPALISLALPPVGGSTE